MKQFTFTIILFLATAVALQAQNLEFVYAQDTVRYDPSAFQIDAKANLKNIGDSTVTLFAERTVNDTASGHQTNFCWGTTCFGSDFNNSALLNISITMRKDDIDSTYKLTLTPGGNSGTTNVTMRLYNGNNLSNYVEHSVVFVEDPTASISQEDLARGFDLSNPYPNPAEDMAWIDYTLPANVTAASLRISDMQGRVIGVQQINTFEERAQIQTSELATGVYFVNLMAEDRVIAVSKLRVR